jgi:diguanylate cyclase (GGDEF)-like protein/PAS domain S-box-containing protein
MPLPNLSDNQKLGLFQGLLQTMEDGVILIDRDFTVLLANGWLERRYAAKAPIAGQKCFSALFGRADTCTACPYLRGIERGTPQRQTMRSPGGQGDAGWLELYTYPLRNASGSPAGAIEYVRDTTERRLLEDQLRDEAVRRQLLFEQSPVGVVALSVDGAVVEANAQFAHMLGYTVEQLSQLHIWDWDTQTDRGRLQYMLETAEAVRDHFETSYQCKDGTQVRVEVFSSGVVVGGNTLIFHLCRDVTEKKAMQQQVRDVAVRDPLTGLYNARYIFERLAENASEYRRGKGEFCLSILEVDKFKELMQFHGSKPSEQALKELAQIISSAIRPYDLLGRYGSNEFILVSQNTSRSEAGPMMERISRIVRESSFTLEGHKIRFTLSCGISHSSEFAKEGFSTDAIVSRAELRLSEAKASGQGRYAGPPAADPEAPASPAAATAH